MSATITPLYNMNVVAGEAFMNQIALQLKTMQETKETTTKKYNDWRAIVAEPVAPSPQQGTDLMATSIITVLLDSLFGMGFFSGVGGGLGVGLGEAAQGVAQLGLMEHASHGNMQRAAKMNEDLSKRAFIGSQQTQSQQMKLMQQMMAMLLMNMLSTQTTEDGESSTGGSKGQRQAKRNDNIVSSVWGQDTLELFKKNRKCLVKAEDIFSRQISDITEKFAPLRYAYN